MQVLEIYIHSHSQICFGKLVLAFGFLEIDKIKILQI